MGDNSLLLATKSQIYWTNVNVMLDPTEEGLDRAEDFARRALNLDPDFPLGIFVRGLVAGLRGQVERALEDLLRAHELRPGDANVIAELCRFSNAAGLRNHGRLVDEVVRIDPLTPVTPLVVSTYNSVNGRHDEGAAAARRSMEMASEVSPLHILAAWQIAESGSRDEACEVLEKVGAVFAGTGTGSWALFLENALQGNVEGALTHATELQQTVRGDHWTRMTADGYALIGRRDDALRWVRLAIGYGFINYPCLAAHDPFLVGLRDDLEFQELLDGLKGRWEAVVEWERRSD